MLAGLDLALIRRHASRGGPTAGRWTLLLPIKARFLRGNGALRLALR